MANLPAEGALLMNQREKEEYRQLWIARLCELSDSGMTQEEWCRQHNIPYSTLRYWISKLKQERTVKTHRQTG
jgi:predicted transcriptional regulator